MDMTSTFVMGSIAAGIMALGIISLLFGLQY
jgi:hypothetical protein